MQQAESIYRESCRWMLAQLTERRVIEMPLIGTFGTRLVPSYIQIRNGVKTIYPPKIVLSFEPTDTLLDLSHYSVLEPPMLHVQIPGDMASAVADLLEISVETVSEVLKDMITETLQSLFRGRRVTFFEICDLFMTDEGPNLLLLNCDPTKVTSDTLNRPFTPYTPTILKPGVDFRDLLHYGEGEEPESEEVLKFKLVAPLPKEAPTPPSSVIEQEITLPPQVEAEVPEAPRKGRSSLPLWLGISGFIAVSIVAVLWLGRGETPKQPQQVEVIPVEESVVEEEPAPVAPVLPLDTIQMSSGQNLYKYAHEYYGERMYWIYIYMENAERIKDPNNIHIGTTLVIPHLAKYNLQADHANTLREAGLWEYIIMTGHYKSYQEQRPGLLERLQSQ